MVADMSERRRLILKLVIQEYIEGSLPVSSDLITRKYVFNVSPATVRNELAALEDLGYLTHLHTSAGRVPTDTGYRFFVENLMDRAPLSAAEQRTIRHQFYQVRSELDQWIQLAGAVLARTAQSASVVTTPRSYQSRFKHLELIAIYDVNVLMVLVLYDGTVRQQTVTLGAPVSQDELSRTALRINDRFPDAPVTRFEEQLAQPQPPLEEIERATIELVVKTMHQFEDQLNSGIHSDGLIEMLGQPEFAQVGRIRQLMEILQGGRGLVPLLPQALASNGVQVVIGGEHSQNELREYSVVLARYGVDGEVAGVLGIIGPTRMAYPRAISTVRYISTVMSDLLGEIYMSEERRAESGDARME